MEGRDGDQSPLTPFSYLPPSPTPGANRASVLIHSTIGLMVSLLCAPVTSAERLRSVHKARSALALIIGFLASTTPDGYAFLHLWGHGSCCSCQMSLSSSLLTDFSQPSVGIAISSKTCRHTPGVRAQLLCFPHSDRCPRHDSAPQCVCPPPPTADTAPEAVTCFPVLVSLVLDILRGAS